MSSFTVTHTARCNVSAGAATKGLAHRRDLAQATLYANQMEAQHQSKAKASAFWEQMKHQATVSRADAAHCLHHLVRYAAAYQLRHESELLGLGGMCKKNVKKVLLFLGDKEEKLHEDICNLLDDELDRDHRVFVANEIAKLELFQIPTAQGIPAHGSSRPTSAERRQSIAEKANAALRK